MNGVPLPALGLVARFEIGPPALPLMRAWLARLPSPSSCRRLLAVGLGLSAALAGAGAQEITGLALLDTKGNAVWGANIALIDSLGREAASARSNRRGEFSVRAPVPGTYWLQLSARTVGRMASPVFVLDSGATLHYEHIFRKGLRALVTGDDFSAQAILQGPFRDSTSGAVVRSVAARGPHVQVSVLNAVSGLPLVGAEVALVAVDSRFEQVIGGRTGADGSAGWLDMQPGWYRVVARQIGVEPGGTRSFPILGGTDSVSVVLRLGTVTVLDAVTVMEQRITAFGFNLKLMSRYYLGGDDLTDRNPAARNVDELIMSLRIPGLSVATGEMSSLMAYRGQRVRVFILDGSRTSGDLPLVEPSAVESLMFIPPNEAGAIFGADASGGALIINTRQTRRR